MRTVWLTALALVLAGLATPLLASDGNAAGPVFQVDYSNPGLTPSHWTLTLRPDGSGHFRSVQGREMGNAAEEIKAPDIDRDIRVSGEFAEQVFASARQQKLFVRDCESHLKVAFQGWKKLSYSGPEGQWGCQFNYARDKEIQELGESLVAVADTIVEGARLEALLQYDRLGLDKEMEYLVAAAGDRRVLEIGVIRGTLERLAEDPAVMERVRKRARVLLAKAGNGE